MEEAAQILEIETFIPLLLQVTLSCLSAKTLCALLMNKTKIDTYSLPENSLPGPRHCCKFPQKVQFNR